MDIFICKNCGKEFISSRFLYGKEKEKGLDFCCASCATMYIRHNKRPNFYSKNDLERNIKQIILNEDRYMTLQEITSILHISSKTLTKYNVSILQLNKECGKRKPYSMFASIIERALRNIFDDLETEKSFSDCLSPKGFLLFYDFYSKKNNLLIEADGTQHKDKNNPFFSEYYHECDLIKDNYAINKNISLIRIPYKKNITENYIYELFNKYIRPTSLQHEDEICLNANV